MSETYELLRYFHRRPCVHAKARQGKSITDVPLVEIIDELDRFGVVIDRESSREYVDIPKHGDRVNEPFPLGKVPFPYCKSTRVEYDLRGLIEQTDAPVTINLQSQTTGGHRRHGEEGVMFSIRLPEGNIALAWQLQRALLNLYTRTPAPCAQLTLPFEKETP